MLILIEVRKNEHKVYTKEKFKKKKRKQNITKAKENIACVERREKQII